MTTEYNRAAQESINLPSDDSGKVDQGKHRRKQTIERRRVTRVTQNDQIEMRREEEERRDKNEQVEEGTQVKLNKLEGFFFDKFHLFFFSLQTFSVRKALHLVGNRNIESQKSGRWNKK